MDVLNNKGIFIFSKPLFLLRVTGNLNVFQHQLGDKGDTSTTQGYKALNWQKTKSVINIFSQPGHNHIPCKYIFLLQTCKQAIRQTTEIKHLIYPNIMTKDTEIHWLTHLTFLLNTCNIFLHSLNCKNTYCSVLQVKHISLYLAYFHLHFIFVCIDLPYIYSSFYILFCERAV